MASNINPSLTPVNSLDNFRFWCQKVLPLVYDDSLSYYEVLGKMVVQLNDVIDNVNADTENVLTLKDAFLELQTYVNNFFDDIDQLASYAERAEAAQTAANTSAVNAATSASNASASSLAAMDARDTAVAARQAAQASANTASTAATNANTKANEAAQSAITAQTAQASASQSATLAATDRSAAQTAASTATTKASEASTSATNAETSANNAAQSKEDAEEAANNIQENLDNIQKNTQDISDLKESINKVLPAYVTVKGDINNSGIITDITAQASEKNERIVFFAHITNFTSLFVGASSSSALDVSANYYNTVEITSETIDYRDTPSSVSNPQNHGLTIENNIAVIIEALNTTTAKITLISNGNSFSFTTNYNNNGVRRAFAFSSGNLTNCILSWTCTQFYKKIWFFGDSYLTNSAERWVYYLAESGYRDNILINAFAGANSAQNFNGFNQLRKHAIPKFAVWCCGMNDPNDSGSTPDSTWLTQINNFIDKCNELKITPILATIPSTPTNNHNGKNTWVKNSGNRYIDFANAVTNPTTGEWYEGMLSSDNTHPTVNGAKALYAQVLVDFPEIMITDYATL